MSITFEQLDTAVKAARVLGFAEGEDNVRTQYNDMRVQLNNMLKTNRELFRPLMKAHSGTRCIKLTPCFARNIIRYLEDTGKHRESVGRLKSIYETTVGPLHVAEEKTEHRKKLRGRQRINNA